MRKMTKYRSSLWVVVCSLAMAWPRPFLGQTQTKPTPPPAAKPAAPSAQDEVVGVDPGWPRSYTAPTGPLTIYQPQVASWDEQKHMVAWSAVSYERKGGEKPALGTIKIEADTRVAVDDRLVSFNDFAITESNFATLTADQTQSSSAGLQQAMPRTRAVIALDRVLAAVDKSAIRRRTWLA